MSDSVTNGGWKLFAQRIEKSKTILEQASALHDKSPEWYVTMQNVALAQGWDAAQQDDLLKQASAVRARLLLHLHGTRQNIFSRSGTEKMGSHPDFAQTIADEVGGDDGDVALLPNCQCNRVSVSGK